MGIIRELPLHIANAAICMAFKSRMVCGWDKANATAVSCVFATASGFGCTKAAGRVHHFLALKAFAQPAFSF